MTNHNLPFPDKQQLVDEFLRSPDVLESVLAASMDATPATPEQVKAFLATAPPEVFVLLDGLLAPPSPSCFPDESVYENRIAQGFVSVCLRPGGPR